MKKYLPYLFAILLTTAVILLVASAPGKQKAKLPNQRVTLRKSDKIPYGTWVAYHHLSHIFPTAALYTNYHQPGYWDSISIYDEQQALLIITGKFNADDDEMNRLISFAEKGNEVFISARTFSFSAGSLTGTRVNNSVMAAFLEEGEGARDSLQVLLSEPVFGANSKYTYPGRSLDASFSSFNKKTSEILGTDERGEPNFIRLRIGKGNIFLHLAPLSFSNYFLLHKNNVEYYEKVLSVIDPGIKKLAWDEYYLNKRFLDDDDDNKKNWFTVLMQAENANGEKSFQVAFWLLAGLLLLFILQEMRRKQRLIPVMKPPRNDSMDFVQTIGRLYYDKGDHANLSRKMSAYFLEYVRNKYKLLTNSLDDSFTASLAYKSGVEEMELRQVISFINYLDSGGTVDEKQIRLFHDQLERFYRES